MRPCLKIETRLKLNCFKRIYKNHFMTDSDFQKLKSVFKSLLSDKENEEVFDDEFFCCFVRDFNKYLETKKERRIEELKKEMGIR